jgi:hypothetical protein
MTSKALCLLTPSRRFPSWLSLLSRRCDLSEEMFILYPNKPNKIVPSDLESLRRIIIKKRKISEKVKSMVNVENWSWLSEELTELRLQFQEMREILIKILNR